MKSKSDITKLLMLLIAAICTILTAEARNFHLAQDGKLLPFTTFGQAMEKANPNDTIYLGGVYVGTLNITKPTIIIGSPATRAIVEINLKEEYQKTGNVILEGITHDSNSYNHMIIKTSINKLILKNVIFPYIESTDKSLINHLIIDRCNVSLFKIRSTEQRSNQWHVYADTVSVRNSIIGSIGGKALNPNTTFIKNSFINRIGEGGDFEDGFYGTLFNCIYSTNNNSYNEVETFYSYCAGYYFSEYSCEDIEDLIRRGFISDDGTVAGPYGGEEPTYSLTPDYPTTQQGSIEFDKVNKKLKIKVKAYEE